MDWHVSQFYCFVQFRLCRSQWNGCAKASRRVLVLQYWRAILKVILQVIVGGLHWNGYIMDAILHVRICTKHFFFG